MSHHDTFNIIIPELGFNLNSFRDNLGLTTMSSFLGIGIALSLADKDKPSHALKGFFVGGLGYVVAITKFTNNRLYALAGSAALSALSAKF
jgi:hypothetical protein